MMTFMTVLSRKSTFQPFHVSWQPGILHAKGGVGSLAERAHVHPPATTYTTTNSTSLFLSLTTTLLPWTIGLFLSLAASASQILRSSATDLSIFTNLNILFKADFLLLFLW
jgi:hypothetical protein